MADDTSIVDSLPDGPVPESFLNDLEVLDRVETAIPMMVGVGKGDEEGEDPVHSIALQIDDAHALVHDPDIEGWRDLGPTDSIDEATFLIQRFQEEQFNLH